MNTIKNYQFDFTTIGSNNEESNCPTFRSMKPQFNIDTSTRQSLDKKKQEYLRNTIDKPQAKPNFNISQIKSDTSFSSIPVVQEIDISETLADLQQKVIEQILILRQQKLTLMEQHNTITQNRFRIQRQLNKIKKKRQMMKNSAEMQTNHSFQLEQLPSANIQPQPKQKQQNKDQKMIQQQHIITRISNIQSAVKQLQRQIIQIQNKSSQKNISEETTKMNSKMQRFSSFSESDRKDYDEIEKLRAKKQKLLNRMANQTEKQELKSCLMMLVKSNRDLQVVLDEHFYRQEHMVQILKGKIRVEESQKQQLLQDLVTIKSKSKHLKLENQELRKALTFFRF